MVVEIERATRKKPFLGGYRHKKTSIEFHHASAQTMAKQRPPPSFERFCRDTQTVQLKHIPQQTYNDMSTQMTTPGVYVSNMPDKLVVPGKYTSAEDYHKNILLKVCYSCCLIKNNTPFAPSKNYLDHNLDCNLDCDLDCDPDDVTVYMGHSLSNRARKSRVYFA